MSFIGSVQGYRSRFCEACGWSADVAGAASRRRMRRGTGARRRDARARDARSSTVERLAGSAGWNEQPVGMPRRSGGEPGIPVSSRARPAQRRERLQQPSLYGCSESVYRSADRASSTIRPPYMIAIRSENSTSSDRSCVMNRTENPNRSRSSTSWRQDLPLHHHVERGGRLVHDDDLRVAARAPSRSSRAAACRRTAGAGTRRSRSAEMPTSLSSSRARVAAVACGSARGSWAGSRRSAGSRPCAPGSASSSRPGTRSTSRPSGTARSSPVVSAQHVDRRRRSAGGR